MKRNVFEKSLYVLGCGFLLLTATWIFFGYTNRVPLSDFEDHIEKFSEKSGLKKISETQGLGMGNSVVDPRSPLMLFWDKIIRKPDSYGVILLSDGRITGELKYGMQSGEVVESEFKIDKSHIAKIRKLLSEYMPYTSISDAAPIKANNTNQ